MPRRLAVAALVLYIATIWLANYLVQHVGIVSVGFGLVAPAGVFVAGAALSLRDMVQRELGRRVVAVAILAGAAVSWWISPTLAVASAAAFLVSETIDFAVYTPLEDRSLLAALIASNTAGAAVDSALFLWLAFSSEAFFWGQLVGKLEATVPFVVLLVAHRARERAA